MRGEGSKTGERRERRRRSGAGIIGREGGWERIYNLKPLFMGTWAVVTFKYYFLGSVYIILSASIVSEFHSKISHWSSAFTTLKNT